MVWGFGKPERLLGFLYGISMLLAFPVHCNKNATIEQIYNKAKEMQHYAEQLADNSLTEHGLSKSECSQPLPWFTKPVMNNFKNKTALLKELERNLLRFYNAFDALLHDDEIHTEELSHTEMIQQAMRSIEALRSNIQTLITKRNTADTDVDLPPATIYEKKVYCCVISHIYKDSLSNVTEELEKVLPNRRKRKQWFPTHVSRHIHVSRQRRVQDKGIKARMWPHPQKKNIINISYPHPRISME
ncbi:uncharacterized protein [Hyperolius riggenbachi]|uniref:uncharacterized protein n=1 Tax=Hyperolius riggenbachi TaxID=752182 RepID=UPI0035A3A1EC